MTHAGKVLIDTDIVPLYLRKQAAVVNHAQKYLAANGWFSFSLITRFEILRGMKARGATSRLRHFDTFCANNEILGVHDQVVVHAADIYAELHRTGKIIGDADILIAATALEHDLPIVTNNTSHFSRIKGLTVLNWNQ